MYWRERCWYLKIHEIISHKQTANKKQKSGLCEEIQKQKFVVGERSTHVRFSCEDPCVFYQANHKWLICWLICCKNLTIIANSFKFLNIRATSLRHRFSIYLMTHAFKKHNACHQARAIIVVVFSIKSSCCLQLILLYLWLISSWTWFCRDYKSGWAKCGNFSVLQQHNNSALYTYSTANHIFSSNETTIVIHLNATECSWNHCSIRRDGC